MAKQQVTRNINGVDTVVTINPKYAGASTRPVNQESSARHFIQGGQQFTEQQVRKMESNQPKRLNGMRRRSR